MNTKLYLVGRYISGRGKNIAWDFIGIYSSRKKGLENVKYSQDFITPVELNAPDELGMKSEHFDNCEYPLQKKIYRNKRFHKSV